MLAYFEELTRRSPLITLEKIGETSEGRPLVLAIVTSEKNRRSLDVIRRNIGMLANGEADSARASEIARGTPAVVWLAFGIHGNESSSSETSMLVASALLRDRESGRLLDDLVVVIDPLQNPDGRERYIQWFHRTRGARPNKNPDAFEHLEPWPGGRFNHYLYDLNRDWTWGSQLETRARLAVYPRWNPQVFVDFHEMSHQSSYFFPPAARPINANIAPQVTRWLETFGRANATQFSRRGWLFFVAERFDLFGPFYGDSWPSLRGAIGMTYEVAGGGRAGTVVEREDGSTLSLADRIDRHFTSAVSTLRTAAEHREQLLLYTYKSVRAQIDGGKNSYLIAAGSPNFEPMLEMLERQGIRVSILQSPLAVRATRIGGAAETRTFPAGTALVTTRQPQGRLAQTLLERTPEFTTGFLEEQRAKAEADETEDFYDLTTWSLPLAMNVETYVTSAPVAADLAPRATVRRRPFQRAQFAYVIDGHESNLYRFAGGALHEGIQFSVADSPLTFEERTFPRGSIIVLKGNNGASVDELVERTAARSGVHAVPIDTGWSGGATFGSERIRYVRDPKIALVGGAGVSPTSFGMLWHTLDEEIPIPHTVVPLDSLRVLDLSKYRVLVLPDGEAYADRLGKRGIERLQGWIREGGTLVAIRGAAGFLREKETEISKLKPWEPPKKKEDDEKPREERYHEFRVPGAAFRSSMNARSYLTLTVPRAPAVLVEGTGAFPPLAHKVDNILTIAAADPLVSGVAWPESIERLKRSVFIASEPYGRGTVITFTNDPYVRLFWRGTLPLFLNAVLYSPSFPR
ncbi:MAG TPA: M14 family zinc carboxypeptidase, partial [Tepidiformaceae bacterium]|nr:M14 family zinc carboxypeptidase [Tepidiformaceae bacterium]